MERPSKLKRESESESIRTVIDDALLAEEVMASVRELRRRGTLRDAYNRADRE
jgi:hypothetical protein